jgi:hypothetical protein
MVDNDAELMAALFVSDDGELRVELEWELDEVTVGRSGRLWTRLSVPEPVAAGILRLIRERDEARQKAADWEQTARELTARVKP